MFPYPKIGKEKVKKRVRGPGSGSLCRPHCPSTVLPKVFDLLGVKSLGVFREPTNLVTMDSGSFRDDDHLSWVPSWTYCDPLIPVSEVKTGRGSM